MYITTWHHIILLLPVFIVVVVYLSNYELICTTYVSEVLNTHNHMIFFIIFSNLNINDNKSYMGKHQNKKKSCKYHECIVIKINYFTLKYFLRLWLLLTYKQLPYIMEFINLMVLFPFLILSKLNMLRALLKISSFYRSVGY